jgi:subtilisin-like proprotein convertase family protein
MPHSRTRPWLLPSAAAVLVGGLAGVAPAVGATGIFTQPAPITVERLTGSVATAGVTDVPLELSEGGSTSAVGVSAPERAIATRVSVSVEIEHDSLDDVDLVLMAPNEQAVTLASDVGGDTAVNGTLQFSHQGSAFNDGSILSLGGAGVPTDYDTPGDDDAFPHPTTTSLRALGGSKVDGSWTLYAYDDSDDELTGSVVSWSIRVEWGVPALPEASTLTVSGMPPGVTDVNLLLDDVTGWVGRTEFLLESPGGRFAHVLSDFAEDNDLEKVDLTLDDQATETIPRSAAPVSGSYRPRNYDDPDDLSEPVAGIETIDMRADLSVFDGEDANGTWKLWVFQEAAGGPVSIAGWSLQITTTDAAVAPPAVPTIPQPPTTDTTAPVLNAVKLTPKRLPTGVGARLRVESTEAAKLVGRVQRKRNDGWKHVGTKSWTVLAGANTRSFYGRAAQARLRSGTYRVLLVATDAAGNASAEVRRRFTVDRG